MSYITFKSVIMAKRRNQEDNFMVKKLHADNMADDYFQTLRKIVIRNDDDPHVFINAPCDYIKIGQYIYKTKPYNENWIQDKNITEYVGLTIAQYQDVEPYIFDKMILVSGFNEVTPIVKNLTVNLTTDSGFKIVTKKFTIGKHIIRMLANHIVGYGQNILTVYMGIPIMVEIEDIDNMTVGKIDNTTKIEFNDFDPNIIICNKCINLASKSVKVSIISCLSCVNSTSVSFPIILDRKTVDKYVRNAFDDTFADNDVKTYKDNNLEFDFKIKAININKQTKYKNIYRISNDDKLINSESNTTDVIIVDDSKPADKICFKISSLASHNYTINDRILYANDIIDYVKSNVTSLTTNQYIKYPIDSNGKMVSLAVNYINPLSTNVVMYDVIPQTVITFDTESKSKFILVHNKNPYEIKKITFKLDKVPNDNIFDMLAGMVDSSDKTQLFDIKKLEKIIRAVFPTKTALKHTTEINYAGNDCMITVKELDFGNRDIAKSKYATYGLITDKTEFKFVTSKNNKSYSINTGPDVKLLDNPIAEMEKYVGGLTDELKVVVRNICLSRGKLREEFKKRGLKPVRGIIFHGAPGTGKTCMARQLGKLLGCEGDRFRLMSGPEIFSKWVGDSEKNIREIFKPAKEAWKKHGLNAPMYMVVIDEIDAMLPARGRSPGNSVRDTVVNQFLAEMDGLEQFNNLIVIGITNLLSLIDPAILRPGRFSIHIKIDLPKRAGRKKIFEIHAKKLIELDRLGQVDFAKLVDLTDGYSGADIEAIVEMASTFSLERVNKLEVIDESVIKTVGKITQADFNNAISELRKMKGDDYTRHWFI